MKYEFTGKIIVDGAEPELPLVIQVTIDNAGSRVVPKSDSRVVGVRATQLAADTELVEQSSKYPWWFV